MTIVKSGGHLGVMREWIKWNARNGDQVQWASNDVVQLKSLSVNELEILAQEIRNKVFEETKHLLYHKVCDNFEPTFTKIKIRDFDFCEHCGNHKRFHKGYDED